MKGDEKDDEMKFFREILRKKGKKKCTADKSAVHSKVHLLNK